MNTQESISQTKAEFEKSFATKDFYNKQTQDNNHLQKILEFIPLKSNIRVLDLGTGSGYLSFEIAKEYPDIQVTGLDIVEKALEDNRKKAKDLNVNNLEFISYNGIEFPFNDNEFDIVVSRYALHHFPQIKDSVKEVSRVLKTCGYFFISDPAPNDDDIDRFVDAYMQLKKDGHIKFYTLNEWIDICKSFKFELKDSFESFIRFPKLKDTAYGFDELIKKYDKDTIAGYELEIIGNEIYVTEKVNNVLFCKCK